MDKTKKPSKRSRKSRKTFRRKELVDAVVNTSYDFTQALMDHGLPIPMVVSLTEMHRLALMKAFDGFGFNDEELNAAQIETHEATMRQIQKQTKAIRRLDPTLN